MDVNPTAPKPSPSAPAKPIAEASPGTPPVAAATSLPTAGKAAGDMRSLSNQSAFTQIQLEPPGSKSKGPEDPATTAANEGIRLAQEGKLPQAQEAFDKSKDLQRFSSLAAQAAEDAPRNPELARQIRQLREQAADPATTPQQRKELLNKAEMIAAAAKKVGESEKGWNGFN